MPVIRSCETRHNVYDTRSWMYKYFYTLLAYMEKDIHDHCLIYTVPILTRLALRVNGRVSPIPLTFQFCPDQRLRSKYGILYVNQPK